MPTVSVRYIVNDVNEAVTFYCQHLGFHEDMHPAGWNRFSLQVTDIEGIVETLRKAGAQFRNDVVSGVGGKQILLDDPSGNPIELFEPTIPEASLTKSD